MKSSLLLAAGVLLLSGCAAVKNDYGFQGTFRESWDGQRWMIEGVGTRFAREGDIERALAFRGAELTLGNGQKYFYMTAPFSFQHIETTTVAGSTTISAMPFGALISTTPYRTQSYNAGAYSRVVVEPIPDNELDRWRSPQDSAGVYNALTVYNTLGPLVRGPTFVRR
ncbi:hypothetical protein SU48_12140 [Deinococcus puniceus]|uniref:Lipoprotein n=2 Tax=Deinococcus puniceus TaxID=1182568 RepID=A0A172TBQ1_9DEIO|nr:hypothetical protein SU48_12140 [Deinococcus puniceus]